MTRNKALGIAIGQFLSYWDYYLTNEQILGAVFDENFDKVTFWRPFENEDGEYVANLIDQLASIIYEASEAV